MARVEYTLPNGQSDFMTVDGEDNIAQFKQAVMTNQWNYAMAQQQNAWNLEQWNRENAYNLPSEQLKRLAAAGINPLLLDKINTVAAGSPNAAGASATLPGYTPQQPLQLQKLQQAIDATQNAQANSMEWLRYQNEQSRLRLDTAMNEEQLKAVRSGVNLSKSQRKGQDIANARAYADYTMTSGSPDYRREFLNNMRYQNVSHRNLISRQEMENDVYRATMNDLKKLPKYQVKKLLADIRIAGEQGKYLEFQRVLRDKYHIDPNMPHWTNLVYMGLRDPDSYAKIANALGKALWTSGSSVLHNIADKFGYHSSDSTKYDSISRSSID